jgi:hypothetical protein
MLYQLSYFRKCVKMIQKKERAENETRTRDPNLGKVMLYQLSYFRKPLTWCPEQDSNLHASRHTHLKRARLPFRHLGILCNTLVTTHKILFM